MKERGKGREEMEREGLKSDPKTNSWLQLCSYARSTWSHKPAKSPVNNYYPPTM